MYAVVSLASIKLYPALYSIKCRTDVLVTIASVGFFIHARVHGCTNKCLKWNSYKHASKNLDACGSYRPIKVYSVLEDRSTKRQYWKTNKNPTKLLTGLFLKP